MQSISYYQSPLGEILLAADEVGLNGLWFDGQKYFALYPDQEYEEKADMGRLFMPKNKREKL